MSIETRKSLGRLGAPVIIVSLRSFRGHVARWAVQQSPYPQGPDGLPEVLLEVCRRFKERGAKAAGVWFASPARVALEPWIQELLLDIPQVQKWNERKNLREGLGFTSALEPEPDPDDDFIDLYALTHNIAGSILAEEGVP